MISVPSIHAAVLQRFRSPGRPAITFALVVLVAIWATFAAYAIDLYRAIEEEAHEELYGSENVMRAHTSGVFRAANTMLSVVEHWLHDDMEQGSAHTLDTLGAMISHLQGTGDQLITVGLIDSDDNGFWRVNRGTILEEKVYLGDRDYVIALRDTAAGTRFIGAPIIGRKSGLRTVPLAIRVQPNALGVKYIVAYLTEDIFNNAFSHISRTLRPPSSELREMTGCSSSFGRQMTSIEAI
ncbi:MAG: hypothetical protein IPK59_02685 [Rhodospirillaceae bacterium]|nr:hypothetical protein [Rhodospirillaceae bacterium]